MSSRSITYVLLAVLIPVSAFAGYLLAMYKTEQSLRIRASGVIVSNTLTVTVTRAPRYLHIEVSPMAFPVLGQSWKIFVYSQNESSDYVYYTPQSNASVFVTAKNGKQATYSLPVDANGQTEFQFLTEYTDVAFSATYGGNDSETIVISTHYVPSDTVDTLLLANGFLSPTTGIVAGLSFRKKKAKVVFSLLITGVFILFIFITVFSIYSKLFLGTIWEYPENVVGSVSLTLLKYATIIGVILFAILSTLAFAVQQRNPKRE
jgi:hypothetical protein